ncbi:hypothetical protein FG05_35421 [Fusarium graminearum]|nr:hypothetical protein FG05_35421 [Fusarium graminearum]
MVQAWGQAKHAESQELLAKSLSDGSVLPCVIRVIGYPCTEQLSLHLLLILRDGPEKVKKW